MTDPERWKQVDSLLQSVLERQATKRLAVKRFYRKLGDTPAIQRKVEYVGELNAAVHPGAKRGPIAFWEFTVRIDATVQLGHSLPPLFLTTLHHVRAAQKYLKDVDRVAGFPSADWHQVAPDTLPFPP